MFDRVKAALVTGGEGSSDFDLNPEAAPGPDRTLRPAAVLVPLIQRQSGIQVVLTKRSSRLEHHPGQIAFPGGKVEQSDESVFAAAVREAHEEIALPLASVEVLGALAPHETVTNFIVTPVVGRINGDFVAQPEAGEVAEVFEVPLAFVTDPSRFTVESRMWQRRRRYYYTVPYGPYYIWGATARILRGLAERMS
jgi:8-oxo-dGTP pyrophosphatase MutT (NUDIX family)